MTCSLSQALTFQEEDRKTENNDENEYNCFGLGAPIGARSLTRHVLENIAKSTQAAAEAANAVKKTLDKKKRPNTDWSKLLTKPNVFDCKNQEEIRAFRELSRVFEKYNTSIDGFIQDVKEIREKPSDTFGMDLGTCWREDKVYQDVWTTGFIDAWSSIASCDVDRGSNGFDAWR